MCVCVPISSAPPRVPCLSTVNAQEHYGMFQFTWLDCNSRVTAFQGAVKELLRSHDMSRWVDANFNVKSTSMMTHFSGEQPDCGQPAAREPHASLCRFHTELTFMLDFMFVFFLTLMSVSWRWVLALSLLTGWLPLVQTLYSALYLIPNRGSRE